jgi:hypothetical protein
MVFSCVDFIAYTLLAEMPFQKMTRAIQTSSEQKSASAKLLYCLWSWQNHFWTPTGFSIKMPTLLPLSGWINTALLFCSVSASNHMTKKSMLAVSLV